MYDNLFEPVPVGRLQLRNRIVRAAHATGSVWSDDPADLIAYHRARAQGMVAMSVLQTGGVHPSAAGSIPVYSDSVLKGYERLVSAIAPHGMKLFQQLQHQGNAATHNLLGGPLWSASDVPNPLLGVVPQPMTKLQIDEIVAHFAAAAVRARVGGLDGVEIQAAHGYLIGQFLSPATNRRTDDYGGSAENRVRFLMEVLQAVRSAVGPEFAVGVRFSADELVPGGRGLGPSDMVAIAQLAEPLVDYISVSLGSYYHYHLMVAPMDAPLGYELPTSEVVTRAVTVPTIVTGRIMSLDHASQIVADGQADLISMVRALIADPELVSKSREGRSAHVRPCISSNQGCQAKLFTVGRMGCVVNVAAGQEARTPFDVSAPAEQRKRVMVVGGGPAGLEAARTAALRGHDVTLYEMTRQLGGQAEIASTAPFRSDLRSITRWLADEIARLGVQVHRGRAADPDTVAELAPDVVVIATGSSPRRDGAQAARPGEALAGIDRPHVFTSWDLFGFGGRARVGSDVLVFDDVGGYEALSVTDELVSLGARVTFVSRLEAPGASVPFPAATIGPVRERLAAADITVLPHSYLVEITADTVVVASMLADHRRTVTADTVIFVGHNHPNTELAEAISDCGAQVIVVGDAASAAVGGQGLEQAIHGAAHRLREI
jgi:2,4-dienoyl-CoA reductase-like NADH-dependent reductase (Old Yellow Enzyme family)/thioredoxin reductase